MSTINVKLNEQEYAKLSEYRDPSKWDDWKELSKKQRYILQRMLVGQSDIVKDIAKEASHNLGNCRWCDHEPYAEVVRSVFK